MYGLQHGFADANPLTLHPIIREAEVEQSVDQGVAIYVR